jgi:hypothetical protein
LSPTLIAVNARAEESKLKNAGLLREVFSRLRNGTLQASETAQQIERGQSAAPIHDFFRGLQAAIDHDSLAVAVVGSDAQAQLAVVAWLCGERDPWPAGQKLPSLDLELSSASQATASMSNRRSANRLEELLRDVALDGEASDQCFAALPASNVCLRLLVPNWTSVNEPAAVARLSVLTGVVILAESDSASPAPDWALREFAGMHRIRVLVGAGDSTPAGHAEIIRLEPGQPLPPLPVSLTDREDLLGLLLAKQLARRLATGICLLDYQLATETRRIEARRRIIARKLPALSGTEQDGQIREMAEAARRLIDVGVDQLDQTLDDRCRNRTLAASTGLNRIRNFAEDLGPEDLIEERTGQAVSLMIHPSCIHRLSLVVEEQIAMELGLDSDLISSGFNRLVEEVASIVSMGVQIAGPAQVAAPPMPVLSEISRPLEFRHRAELPVRGFLDLISHGRRPLMMVTMLASLVGAAFGAASSLQASLAPLLLIMFVGSLACAVFDFRHERHERFDKELQKLRENLETETRRLYEQTARDWCARARRQLREIHKVLAGRADELLRGRAAESSRRATDERRDVHDKSKLLDARLRELTGLAERVRRLAQTVDETLVAVNHGLATDGKN